ncbi:MAG TPA: hypothetical protein VG759_16295 [Candidatus Angelobacter sp.]|jgi:hypothetical protein|nr:hypothetical protein [Candidatus Angelobacter sp.]
MNDVPAPLTALVRAIQTSLGSRAGHIKHPLSSYPRIFGSTARGLDFNELGRPATANDLAAPAKDHKAHLSPKRGIAEVIEFIAEFPDGGSCQGVGGWDRDETQDKQNSEKKGTQRSETCIFHGIVISPFDAKYSSRWRVDGIWYH